MKNITEQILRLLNRKEFTKTELSNVLERPHHSIELALTCLMWNKELGYNNEIFVVGNKVRLNPNK